MNEYTISLPSIQGIISDDYLYFEGVRTPPKLSVLRDKVLKNEDVITLERYWGDIYNLFLRKLTLFASSGPCSDEDIVKLQALLQELIKIKSLIENAGKTDTLIRR